VECSAVLYGGRLAVRCEEVLWEQIFDNKNSAEPQSAVEMQ
jgi:hypothetical protein